MAFDTKRITDGIPHDVTFTYEGEEIHLTFNLAAIGVDLDKWNATYNGRRATLHWLAQVVTKWDITNGGVPIPITVESMEEHNLPSSLTNMMFAVIQEEASVPNLRRASSAGKPSV